MDAATAKVRPELLYTSSAAERTWRKCAGALLGLVTASDLLGGERQARATVSVYAVDSRQQEGGRRRMTS